MGLPAATVFYTLSYLRTQFMQQMQQGGDTGFTTSPWIFTLVNLFIFSIVVYITHRFLPKISETNEYEEYLQDKKEIDILESEIEELTIEKEAIPAQLRAKLLLRDNIREYVKPVLRIGIENLGMNLPAGIETDRAAIVQCLRAGRPLGAIRVH